MCRRDRTALPSLFVLVLLLAAPLTANAVPALERLVDGMGNLLGARNVIVNGVRYDVEFVDGKCADVYGICDTSAFAFQSEPSASLASQALLSAVLLNGAEGMFDTTPALTRGCGGVNVDCAAFTPYATAGNPNIVFARGAANQPRISPDFVSSYSRREDLSDLALVDEQTWVRWTFAKTVSEPDSIALLVVGLFSAGYATRRRAQ